MLKEKKQQTVVDRDVSWMYFNHRVLQEAGRPEVPLLERLNFLGIYSNNLDEFFRVRISTLHRILEYQHITPGKEIAAAIKSLKRINKLNTLYSAEFDTVFEQLKRELEAQDIYFVNEQQLDDRQATYLRRVYQDAMSSSTYPLIITQGAKLNELTDSGIYLAVKLTGAKRGDEKKLRDYALIELPVREFGRFIVLPGDGNRTDIIFLDDAIRYCLPYIFAGLGYASFEAYTIKFTRDAELDIDLFSGVQEGILEKIARGVRNRKKADPVRFIYDREMPRDMLNYIKGKLSIDFFDENVAGGRYHNMKDLMNFPSCNRSDLRFRPVAAVPIPEFQSSESILATIRRKDLFLHFPYHGFSNYIRILREAALSREVKSIKTTVYRLAKDSQVVKALICAAKHGKKVTVVVELMARFDEESNINWSKKMQEAGINVILGVEGLKIHCKLTHIGSTKGDIACVSTGNFHEGNARLYTDIILMTANPVLTRETDKAFEYIKQPYKAVQFRKLIVSPAQMRKRLGAMINREIGNARTGIDAYILCKINHITDERLIQRLYEASAAGVKMRLLVRGNCSIVTGIPNLSENIEVRGIIDRFLEHSRIFIFCNGGDEQYYIGSADWMARNLDNRIETYMPVYDPVIRQELKRIIEYGLRDNTAARIVDGSGENRMYENGFAPFRSQEELMDHYRILNAGRIPADTPSLRPVQQDFALSLK